MSQNVEINSNFVEEKNKICHTLKGQYTVTRSLFSHIMRALPLALALFFSVEVCAFFTNFQNSPTVCGRSELENTGVNLKYLFFMFFFKVPNIQKSRSNNQIHC